MSLPYSRFVALPGVLVGTLTLASLVSTQVKVAAKTPEQVARLAAPVTVEIDDNVGDAGSGVIIGKVGSTYTVLTANHVVKRLDLNYTIGTSTGKTYSVLRVQRLQPGNNSPDLALVTFDSKEHYPIAILGNSDQVVIGSQIYVSGYPALEGQKSLERNYEFSPGTVTSRLRMAPQGYTLRYNADTVSGMSGSPVFDTTGRVIGIHGEGETVGLAQSQSGETIPIKTGFNAGIPINTFVALETQIRQSSIAKTVNDPPTVTHPPLVTLANHPTRLKATKSLNPNSVNLRQQHLQSNLVALGIIPKASAYYYERANARLEDKQTAIRYYIEAIRLNPQSAIAYNSLGQVRYDLGEKQEAMKDYLKAISLSPKFALAYNNLGKLRYDLGDTQGAIRDYSQAIRLFPYYATAYFNRGVVRYQLGDKQGAIHDYSQAIRLSHNYTLAYYQRGLINNQLGDRKAALADLQHAAAIYRQEGNIEAYQQLLTRTKALKL